jgi:hypothetical protein
MRLYRCRLDMRACHPASAKAVTEHGSEGFRRPAPGFHGSGVNLLETGEEASRMSACAADNADHADGLQFGYFLPPVPWGKNQGMEAFLFSADKRGNGSIPDIVVS